MFKCVTCDKSFSRQHDLSRHKLSKKHTKNLSIYNENCIIIEDEDKNKEENFNIKSINNINFYCQFCNKNFIKKKLYDKHILTYKHNQNVLLLNNNEKDLRVPVINKETMKVKYGKNAPLKSKLDKYLIKYPMYEIYNKNNLKLYNNFLLKLKSELINIINLIDKNLKI